MIRITQEGLSLDAAARPSQFNGIKGIPGSFKLDDESLFKLDELLKRLQWTRGAETIISNKRG